ncbi:MAG: DUF4352 domain-containing protein [Ktedonobacteraceae bacterium]
MNVASPQQQAKKSRRWLWITLTIIGIIGLLSFGLSAFISMAAKSATPPNAVSTNGSLQTRGTTTTTKTMTRTTPATIANVGQTITVQNISCVLVSVHTLSVDANSHPKTANEFIVVHIKLVNNGSNGQNYNPFSFRVINGSGHFIDQTYTSSYTENNELSLGRLAPGGSVDGDLIFEVPAGDHQAKLIWQPNYSGNSVVNAWNLGL